MKLLDKLIEALESDKYTQGYESLCNYRGGKPVGYCCLGVATHLHDPNHDLLKQETDFSSTSVGFYMPTDVKERIEREDPKVVFRKEGEQWDIVVKTRGDMVEPTVPLSSLNDDHRDFKEIAGFIRMTYR